MALGFSITVGDEEPPKKPAAPAPPEPDVEDPDRQPEGPLGFAITVSPPEEKPGFFERAGQAIKGVFTAPPAAEAPDLSNPYPARVPPTPTPTPPAPEDPDLARARRAAQHVRIEDLIPSQKPEYPVEIPKATDLPSTVSPVRKPPKLEPTTLWEKLGVTDPETAAAAAAEAIFTNKSVMNRPELDDPASRKAYLERVRGPKPSPMDENFLLMRDANAYPRDTDFWGQAMRVVERSTAGALLQFSNEQVAGGLRAFEHGWDRVMEPESVLEMVAQGIGQAAGFATGAPVKLARSMMAGAFGARMAEHAAPAVGSLLSRAGATALVKATANEAANLGLASALAHTAEYGKEPTVEQAFHAMGQHVAGGAEMGAVFGAVGTAMPGGWTSFRDLLGDIREGGPELSQKALRTVARIGVGSTAMVANEAAHGTLNTDNIAKMTYDFALNAYFLALAGHGAIDQVQRDAFERGISPLEALREIRVRRIGDEIVIEKLSPALAPGGGEPIYDRIGAVDARTMRAPADDYAAGLTDILGHEPVRGHGLKRAESGQRSEVLETPRGPATQVYHGTPIGFEGDIKSSEQYGGAWVAERPETAQYYATQEGAEDPTIKLRTLRLTNPATEAEYMRVVRESQGDPAEAAESLKEQGHDGVVFEGKDTGKGLHYLVFDPAASLTPASRTVAPGHVPRLESTAATGYTAGLDEIFGKAGAGREPETALTRIRDQYLVGTRGHKQPQLYHLQEARRAPAEIQGARTPLIDSNLSIGSAERERLANQPYVRDLTPAVERIFGDFAQRLGLDRARLAAVDTNLSEMGATLHWHDGPHDVFLGPWAHIDEVAKRLGTPALAREAQIPVQLAKQMVDTVVHELAHQSMPAGSGRGRNHGPDFEAALNAVKDRIGITTIKAARAAIQEVLERDDYTGLLLQDGQRLRSAVRRTPGPVPGAGRGGGAQPGLVRVVPSGHRGASSEAEGRPEGNAAAPGLHPEHPSRDEARGVRPAAGVRVGAAPRADERPAGGPSPELRGREARVAVPSGQDQPAPAAARPRRAQVPRERPTSESNIQAGLDAETELRFRGFSQDAIDRMTPEQIADELENPATVTGGADYRARLDELFGGLSRRQVGPVWDFLERLADVVGRGARAGLTPNQMHRDFTSRGARPEIALAAIRRHFPDFHGGEHVTSPQSEAAEAPAPEGRPAPRPRPEAPSGGPAQQPAPESVRATQPAVRVGGPVEPDLRRPVPGAGAAAAGAGPERAGLAAGPGEAGAVRPVPSPRGSADLPGSDGGRTPRLRDVQPRSIPDVEPDARLHPYLKHLAPFQTVDATRALQAIDRHGATLVASGTGTGKTFVGLSVLDAHRRMGRPVVYVSPASALKIKPGIPLGVTGTIKDAADRMEIPIRVWNGIGPLSRDAINVMTYEVFKKLPRDPNTVIAFDEIHQLRNLDSQRAAHGAAWMRQAKGVLMLSATPLDRAGQLPYLERLGVFEGKGEVRAMQDLGMVKQTDPRSGIESWRPLNNRYTRAKLEALFDRLGARGLVTAREITLGDVAIEARQIPMPPEVNRVTAEIERAFEGPNGEPPKGMRKAQMLNAIRRQQEPYKIEATVDLAKRELAEGRQVVIYLSRINESEAAVGKGAQRAVVAASEGTAKTLKERLATEGITDVGELHGNAETPQHQAVREFQVGVTRVLIATPESGSTGINLDDTHGDRPRTVLVMTAPYGATENVQLAGRVVRLTTRSPSRIYYLDSGRDIDRWNREIVLGKMRTLGAAVPTEITEALGGREEGTPRGLSAAPQGQPPFQIQRPVIENRQSAPGGP